MASSVMDTDRFTHLVESILATAGVKIEQGGDWPKIKTYVEEYIEGRKGRVSESLPQGQA